MALHRNQVIRNILVAMLPWAVIAILFIYDHVDKTIEYGIPKWFFIGLGIIVLNWLFNLLYWAIYVAPLNKNRFIWFLVINHMSIAFLTYLVFFAR